MKDLGSRVEEALARNHKTRSDDNELLIELWEDQGALFTSRQRDIIRSFSMESATRARRKLQADGKYPAVDRVRRARKAKSEYVRHNITDLEATRIPGLIQSAIPWMDDRL